MRFNDSIVLRRKRWKTMPNGCQVPVCTDRRVFCNRMSIGLAARMAAGAEGLRGAERVRIRAGEYEGEQYAVWQGEEMTVESVSSNGEFATVTMARRLGGDVPAETEGDGDDDR